MEKKIDSSLKYNGNILKVYEDHIVTENGVKSVREIIKHTKGVCIAVKDDDGKYFVVKQYRYALSREMIEFCAGKVDGNEDVDVAVVRECEEELGIVPKNLRKLGTIIPACGYCDEELHLYYAEVGERKKQHFDDDEFLTVHKYSLDELNKMVDEGLIDDGKTIALMYYLGRDK